MKYLFCGLGSIGRRHLDNLISLDEKNIIVYRRKNLPIDGVSIKIPIFTDINKAIVQKPDVAFITNPSAFHMQLALKLARSGCHLFIEKPLSINLKGTEELLEISREKKLVIFIGFMMRYHPAVRQIKEWMSHDLIGFPISVRMSCGEYLPLWHPHEDYRKSYAGNAKLGGGPIFTLCHEIDILSWLFGQPVSIFALSSRKSSLEITTEHAVEVLMQFKDKMIAEIHLDYLQNPAERRWTIIGNEGKIDFDYYSNTLELNSSKNKKKTLVKKTIIYTKKFKRNDMFMSELKSFINSIKMHKREEISLQDGIDNLKLLLSTHKSIKEKRLVKIE